MPNVNAAIAMSTTAVCKNEFASDEDLATIKNLFSTIGLTTEVPENQFAIFTAIAGCSPAYVYQERVDKVCSPGGTTIEGVTTLEEYKFTAGVVKAVENSILKDRELSKK